MTVYCYRGVWLYYEGAWVRTGRFRVAVPRAWMDLRRYTFMIQNQQITLSFWLCFCSYIRRARDHDWNTSVGIMTKWRPIFNIDGNFSERWMSHKYYLYMHVISIRWINNTNVYGEIQFAYFIVFLKIWNLQCYIFHWRFCVTIYMKKKHLFKFKNRVISFLNLIYLINKYLKLSDRLSGKHFFGPNRIMLYFKTSKSIGGMFNTTSVQIFVSFKKKFNSKHNGQTTGSGKLC